VAEGAPALSYKTLTGTGQYVGLVAPISGAGEYAVINNAKFPTNDVNVRKAILYSIDRAGLNQLADQNVYPLIWGPLQPGTLGYDPEFAQQKMYAYDPNKAAQILQADGWAKDSNGIWAKNGQELSLVITHIGVGDLPLEAQGIQSYLEKAGMKVTIQEYADDAWHAANVQGVENITPLEFSSLDPDLLRIEFTPGQYFNWSKYNNPQLTRIVTQAESETDPAKRLQEYAQAQQILMNDAAMIPEHENDDLLILNPKVKGIVVLPGGTLDLYSTYIAQ
jgi:peptide/nickel transport system substrate-binding protein